MKDDAKKLGENLKKIRTKKNITQTELAKTLGVDKSFVSNIEVDPFYRTPPLY